MEAQKQLRRNCSRTNSKIQFNVKGTPNDLEQDVFQGEEEITAVTVKMLHKKIVVHVRVQGGTTTF